MLVITSTDGCRYTLVLVLLISVVVYIVKVHCDVVLVWLMSVVV